MDHLVSFQIKCDEDDNDHTTLTEPTSNKIDMSNIDFGNNRIETRGNSTDSKQDSSSKLQVEDNKVLPSSSITSELESQESNDPVQSVSILYEGHEQRID